MWLLPKINVDKRVNLHIAKNNSVKDMHGRRKSVDTALENNERTGKFYNTNNLSERLVRVKRHPQKDK